jgi:transcriptional regulator with XRE-family HTH domain
MAHNQADRFDHVEPHAGELARGVGEAIRAARGRAGMTLSDVGRDCGLSVPFLSQLENGKALPSILTLHRIARTLGTSAHELLMHSAASTVSVVPADEGPAFSFAEDGSIRARFLVRPGLGLSGSEVNGPAGAGLQEHIRQEGWKLYHVLSGEVEFVLAGRPDIVLRAGDTLCHDGTVPHRWRVIGSEPARFIVISTSPL